MNDMAACKMAHRSGIGGADPVCTPIFRTTEETKP